METKAVQYLVTADGTTHLPYTDSAGKPDHRLMGAAWAALHGGYRGNKYEGPNKAEAVSKLTAVYKREGMDTPKSMQGLEFKSFHFEMKDLTEAGTFTGMASVYGNKDLGNDVMDHGALAKTVAERGGKVRLMDSHKTRVGVAHVKETLQGLEVTKGIINLGKQAGQEVYSDLKFYQEHQLPMGMSIGYVPVKADPSSSTPDGARHLKEVSLWEVTLTELPMNTEAQVTAVKSLDDQAIPDLEDYLEAMSPIEVMSALKLISTKVGRRNSAADTAVLDDVIAKLQALRGVEAAEDGTSDDGAAKSATEPAADHSELETLIGNMRSLIPA